MRKKLISLLAAAMLLVTMIPSIASAAVKDEVTTAQTVKVDGEVVATVYYGTLSGGKVNVIVTGKDAIQPIGEKADGWNYYKPNINWNQWCKQYTKNADENVEFALSGSYDGSSNSFTKTQTVNIKFHKFDTQAPVIDPDNTVPAKLPNAERGEDYELPQLPVTDDITKDFTVGPETIYYSETGADGSWTTVDEFTTEKEGWYNVWYSAADDSGKKAEAVRKQVQVVDTKAPIISIEKIADMTKGDILDLTSVKVTATDAGKAENVEKVWLNEILYAENNDSWENYETVWKLTKGEDPIEAYELTQPGYYKLKYRATDNAANTNTGYASTIVKVDELYASAGFIINYVDKDGKTLAESTEVKKEDAVLDYQYDEEGNKQTFCEFKYNEDGYVLNVPEGYYIADDEAFGGLTDPMRVYVENGGENMDSEYDVLLTAVEKGDKAPAKDDKSQTPPSPKTGDETNMGFLAAMLALMAMTGTGAAVIGKRAFNKR